MQLLQKNGKQIMQLLKAETHTQQSRLADYCRTGNTPDLIDIKEDNLYQYRRLVINIALDTLETAYPITHSFLAPDVGDTLVKDFYANHKCQTTQVWRMPLEFFDYWGEYPKTIYLQNHGFIALGKSPADVQSVTMMSDKAARILLGTMSFGGPNFMTQESVDRIHNRPDERYRQAMINRAKQQE